MRISWICLPLLMAFATACSAPEDTPVIEGPAVARYSDPGPYPNLARMARVEGDIVVGGTLDANGRVIECATIEGPPLLRKQGEAWVRQWRFEPNALQSTQPFAIKVEFRLVEVGRPLPVSYPWRMIGIFTPNEPCKDPSPD